MINTNLKGIYSALLVSFDEDGKINENGLRSIVRHNIDKMKIDGLYVGGSTGENFLLSTEEKKEIFRIVSDEANKKVKLIAQVGSLNVYEASELAEYATELDYDAVSAVTPFYYKFSFSEIKNYCNKIIEEVDNRLIVYSIPALTGVDMNIRQFGELFENKKIAGVKFASADFFLFERLRKAYPEHLFFAGSDETMLPAAVLGADGAIGSTFNVNGLRARLIFEYAKEGKINEAKKIQHTTNDFISAVINNGLYPTLKELLKIQGVDAGYCRSPMGNLTDGQKKRSKEIYKQFFEKFEKNEL